jgi:hypothetical protein
VHVYGGAARSAFELQGPKRSLRLMGQQWPSHFGNPASAVAQVSLHDSCLGALLAWGHALFAASSNVCDASIVFRAGVSHSVTHCLGAQGLPVVKSCDGDVTKFCADYVGKSTGANVAQCLADKLPPDTSDEADADIADGGGDDAADEQPAKGRRLQAGRRRLFDETAEAEPAQAEASGPLPSSAI